MTLRADGWTDELSSASTESVGCEEANVLKEEGLPKRLLDSLAVQRTGANGVILLPAEAANDGVVAEAAATAAAPPSTARRIVASRSIVDCV